MLDRNGWWLPNSDTYFAQFCEGPAPKKNGFQREHLTRALKNVKEFGVAIDVGAHVGFWACDMAERFERVHAFEAAPDTYDCLVRNTEGQDNVTTYNFAIGHGAGRVAIGDDQQRLHNTGARYVRKLGTDELNCVEVEMRALDSFDFPRCDFLKVDVEGFELQVLQGAEKLIKKFMPVISMEVGKLFSLKRFKIEHGMAEQWLVDRGYKVTVRMSPDAVFVPA
jgi:FkbM family methyltransferase